MKEALRARLAADAKKAPAPAATTPAASAAPAAASAKATAPAPAPEPAAPGKAENEKESPALMPKVEVKKGRYSARDHQLALDLHAQDQAIEREKKNLKATETDLALNDSKVTKALSIFGGESAQYRQRVAAERLELLEAEKDIIEQIAIAQKPEEKKELQKQLDALRALRRDLEKSLR